MKYMFFEKVAADYNTFYMKYVDQYDAGPDAGLLFEELITDINSKFAVDIPRFLEMFWAAVHMSDLQFGAPAGTSFAASADLHERYPKFI
jgi:hypothetical protein